MVAVIGVPYDATKMTRRGARDGPNAIRESTTIWAARLQAGDFVDLDRDVRFGLPARPRLFDLGNIILAPADVEAMIARVSRVVAEVVRRGALPVVLGGDHFTAYPSTRGFVTATRERHPGARVGYVHVDTHLDLTDHAPYLGRYHSGAPARR